MSCIHGNLKVVKYLLSIPNNKININAYNNYAFRISCIYDHLEVIKYLLSIPDNKININADNDDFIFKMSCSKNKI